MSTIRFLHKVVDHPLNVANRRGALSRWVRWHLGSRLVPGPVLVPFAGGTHLVLAPGMRGGTENIHLGLSEFEDMAFTVHLLRPGDLFVDVGANIGAYSILASGVSRARSIALEPVPSTFRQLLLNLAVNGLSELVEARQLAVGDTRGSTRFTASLDTINHVVAQGERNRSAIVVQIEPLDSVLAGRAPTVLKIDVEGFEGQVLAGARETLRNAALLAIVVETNGSGRRYGYADEAIDALATEAGFWRVQYDPLLRTLSLTSFQPNVVGRNTVYVRDLDAAGERLRNAPPLRVLDRTI